MKTIVKIELILELESKDLNLIPCLNELKKIFKNFSYRTILTKTKVISCHIIEG